MPKTEEQRREEIRRAIAVYKGEPLPALPTAPTQAGQLGTVELPQVKTSARKLRKRRRPLPQMQQQETLLSQLAQKLRFGGHGGAHGVLQFAYLPEPVRERLLAAAPAQSGGRAPTGFVVSDLPPELQQHLVRMMGPDALTKWVNQQRKMAGMDPLSSAEILGGAFGDI